MTVKELISKWVSHGYNQRANVMINGELLESWEAIANFGKLTVKEFDFANMDLASNTISLGITTDDTNFEPYWSFN